MIMYDYKTLEYHKVNEILERFTKTNYAKKRLEDYLESFDFDTIERLNRETREAYLAIVKLGDIPLGGLYEMKDALRRCKAGSILNEAELLNVVGLLDCGMNVSKYFKSLETIKVDVPSIKAYSDNVVTPQALKTNITLAISPEGRINDNASRELFMVRRSLASLENRLRSKLNELLSSKASMLTEALIVQRDGRMCLPVKIEYKNTFKGIVHDISSSNTTAYIEPESTLETANQIDSYTQEEKKQCQIILKNLSLLVSAEADTLLNNLENLTTLDVIYAKALMGKELNYNSPKIEAKQFFSLKRAKHPLLNPDTAVPIDCELGNKYSVIIITGPNTGGKTVALKTVGLLHLMVYNGLMVPASEDSIFGAFEDILADIGDEQSIEQSLSTFSSHMTKIVDVLSRITFNSLVLLDELGSGTDPKEGSSLAISIIEYLKRSGARVICTTHYSELKSYAYKNEGIINASVEFNTETLLPTYRLLMGVPGKSNAIEIASRLGLNQKIIEDAKNELSLTSSESSELIGNLEEEMTSLRNQERELEEKIAGYENMINNLKHEKLELVKKTDKIIHDAKEEAKKIIAEAKEESLKLIEEIKNMSSENFKEHELIALKTKAKNLSVNDEQEEIFDEELHEGDYVYVKTYEKYGTISSIKKDKYYVNLGQFAIEFKKNELSLAAKPEPKKKKEVRLSGYNPASHATLSLDLRGKRVEEVKELMDSYLDQCALGNLKQVSIIHGFGTGAVRKAVQEYLKTSPYVKSYRYGGEGEGLNGVTVVYLK